MTRNSVAVLHAEARRFLDVLAAVKWEKIDKTSGGFYEVPLHGHMARVNRASLELSQKLADLRTRRLP